MNAETPLQTDFPFGWRHRLYCWPHSLALCIRLQLPDDALHVLS